MPAWLALLLGIVQGLTEFLPISSSGHLKLIELLFGLENLDQYMLFEVVCHAGTLIAILLVLWREVGGLLGRNRFTLFLIAIATLPLGLVLPLRHKIEAIYAMPQLLGLFFLATALILYLGERLGRPRPTTAGRRCANALGVGFAQLLAILPGVSRSGSTISMGRILGEERLSAASFAFLMAIPAFVGAIVVQGAELIRGGAQVLPVSAGAYAIGFIASLVTGAASLAWLINRIRHANLMPFAWYCAGVGVLATVYTQIWLPK